MSNDLTKASPTSGLVLGPSPSIPDVQRALTGRCDQARLTGAAAALLDHYFPDRSDARLRKVAEIVRDLAAYSDHVVHTALAEWRRSEVREPTSAGLRQLCAREHHRLNQHLEARAPAPQVEDRPSAFEIPPEEVARRREFAERTLSEVGYRRSMRGRLETARGREERLSREKEIASGGYRDWTEGLADDDPRMVQLRQARAEAAKARSAL